MKILNTVLAFAKKNSTALYLGSGVVCVISGYILAAKAGSKANTIISQHIRYQSKKHDANYVMNKKEKLSLTWKLYLPSTILTGLGISAFIFANNTTLKQKAALSSAYILSERKIKEYQEHLLEKVGPKKTEQVKDAVNDSIINKVDSNNVPLIYSNGEHLCYDSFSDTYFKSTIDNVKRAINDANAKLLSEDILGLNELYDILGFGPMPMAEEFGWEAYDKKQIEPRYSSHLTKDGVPCLVIEYYNRPTIIKGRRY